MNALPTGVAGDVGADFYHEVGFDKGDVDGFPATSSRGERIACPRAPGPREGEELADVAAGAAGHSAHGAVRRRAVMTASSAPLRRWYGQPVVPVPFGRRRPKATKRARHASSAACRVLVPRRCTRRWRAGRPAVLPHDSLAVDRGAVGQLRGSRHDLRERRRLTLGDRPAARQRLLRAARPGGRGTGAGPSVPRRWARWPRTTPPRPRVPRRWTG